MQIMEEYQISIEVVSVKSDNGSNSVKCMLRVTSFQPTVSTNTCINTRLSVTTVHVTLYVYIHRSGYILTIPNIRLLPTKAQK